MEILQVRLRPLAMLGLLLLGILAQAEAKPQAQPLQLQLQSHYLRAMAAYRRLERVLPRQEVRALAGIGLLNGARQAENDMEEHLVAVVRELLHQMNLTEGSPPPRLVSKIDAIEYQLSRDRTALEILARAMDVLSRAKDDRQFRAELHEMAQRQTEEELLQQELSANLVDPDGDLVERLTRLRSHIQQQVPQMKQQLETKIGRALQHILAEAAEDGVLAKASRRAVHKRHAVERKAEREQQPQEQRLVPEEMRVIKSILSEAHTLRFQDDFRENLVEQQQELEQPERRLKDLAAEEQVSCRHVSTLSANVTAKDQPAPARQTDGAASSELGDENDGDGDGDPAAGDGGGGGGGGGLVGIIGSLSGGEGGSDVGALIGALTGLVSTLFGVGFPLFNLLQMLFLHAFPLAQPGGLDVEGLIKTSTSLIAGLLAGDKNFGLVLGQYVGTALEGLSGGGGAINNGQFLGNFLGTVVAALSADPEDEGPPQPLTFTKNLITSFLEAKFRPDDEDGSEERHGSEELPRPRPRKKKEGGGWAATAASHFDSGGFVKQVASHLVSNALGLLLNAGLGASGGASSASKGIFASSSSGHHGGGGGEQHHHRSWSPGDAPY
ncbi:hypothetical protein KR018_005101 [Drosophila ironensis]|nr:hypothetical protein KR018_005101 [Drosophila ironensis]